MGVDEMSDVAQGPGWWQASDGKWYPPAGGAPAKTSGLAIGALIASIASFVVCPIIPAVVALVLVPRASEEIRDSNGTVGGDGLVTAARVIAIINIALLIVVILAFAAVFTLGSNASVKFSRVGSEIRMVLPLGPRLLGF
jgi:uncharacterized membrane protein